MVMVPVRDDNVGDIGFRWVRGACFLLESRLEHGYVLLETFASIKEHVGVGGANQVGVRAFTSELSQRKCDTAR